MAMMFCWRTGVIGIARYTPRGAVMIAKSEAAALKRTLVAARLAYDGKTYLVPGIPEADDDVAAIAAVRAFRLQVLRRLDAAELPSPYTPQTKSSVERQLGRALREVSHDVAR